MRVLCKTISLNKEPNNKVGSAPIEYNLHLGNNNKEAGKVTCTTHKQDHIFLSVSRSYNERAGKVTCTPHKLSVLGANNEKAGKVTCTPLEYYLCIYMYLRVNNEGAGNVTCTPHEQDYIYLSVSRS